MPVFMGYSYATTLSLDSNSGETIDGDRGPVGKHDSLLATNWPMAYLDIGGGCGGKRKASDTHVRRRTCRD